VSSGPWAVGGGQGERPALVAGSAGLLVCALGAFLSPEHFFRTYLVAYIFWLGIALGCMVIVMVQHLTGGSWGIVLRRFLESASRTLPLFVLFFVPLLLGLRRLYLWSDVAAVADPALRAKLEHKSLYLNVPFFLGRTAFYFAVWLAMAYFLNRWSREQDQTGDPSLPARFRRLSAPGLVLYGLTITFASIDWVMSLEPEWFSTIFGALFGTGQVLTAFAFAVAGLILLADRPPVADLLSPTVLRDLGSLLLAFVMLWAYMSFSQFLLIWSGNLPEEISWYVRRLQGGWQWVGLSLILFQFALPFLLLLSSDIKRNGRRLAAVAGFVLAMRFVDLFWMIVPAADAAIDWRDVLLALAALVGVGGIWMAVFLWQLGRMPLLPLRDPYLAEATDHE
jgi:hypothetical protein